MSHSSAVTPAGLRAGDPAALSGLIERRGGAVLAYCAEVCSPELVPRAAAEAFARFRCVIAAAPALTDIDPEGELLRATRQSAAWMARTAPPAPTVSRLLRRKDDPLLHVPTLLVARAQGELNASDRDRLAQLLERSPQARAVLQSFRRAEEAYREDATPVVPADIHAVLAAAMAAAAPVTTMAPATAADRGLVTSSAA